MNNSKGDGMKLRCERRLFLKKSVLALAGVGFASSLIAGCGGDNPAVQPQLPVAPDPPGLPNDPLPPHEAKLRLNNAQDSVLDTIRSMMLTSLGETPVCGNLISAALGVFWGNKSSNAQWAAMVDEINQIVDQRIEAATLARLQKTLSGMQAALSDYRDDCLLESGTALQTCWLACRSAMNLAMPQFEPDGDQSLVPLYCQAALLHMIVYRDGLTNRQGLAWTDQQMAVLSKESSGYLAKHLAVIDAYRASLMTPAENTDETWYYTAVVTAVDKARNKYYLAAGDTRDVIALMDPVAHPGPFEANLTRALYTEPWGHRTYGSPAESVVIDYAARERLLHPVGSIEMHSGGNYVGFHKGYQGRVSELIGLWPQWTGPDGCWSQTYGRNQSDDGVIKFSCTDPKTGPVTSVWFYLGETTRHAADNETVPTLQFGFQDGSYSDVAGGESENGVPTNYSVSLDNHVLADIFGFDVASDGGPVGLIFGWQLPNFGRNLSPKALALMIHRVSMTELSADELKQKVEDAMPADEINRLLLRHGDSASLAEMIASNLDQWKEDRATFWRKPAAANSGGV
ncbi:MAG: hypothetical protein ACRYG5_18960 [Janthinobacterium lividum]